MKTFVRFISAILAVAAAVMGLVAPRSAITSFVLILSGLVALILLVSSFKELMAEMAEAQARREAEEAEAKATKAAAAFKQDVASATYLLQHRHTAQEVFDLFVVFRGYAPEYTTKVVDAAKDAIVAAQQSN